MSTDWAERAFIINTWLLVIGSYVSILAALITLHSIFPAAFLIIIVYFMLNIVYHMAIFETLEVGYDKVKTMFCWKPKTSKFCLKTWLCPFIYWEAKAVKKASLTVGYFMNGLEWLAVIIKGALTIVIITFAFYVNGKTQVFWYVIFAVLHTVLAFYNYKRVQITWYMIVMLVPIIIFFIVVIIYVITTVLYKEWWMERTVRHKDINTERRRREHRSGRPRGRNNSNTILPYNNDGDLEAQTRLRVAIDHGQTPQNMSRCRYNGPERISSIKAIACILTQWKTRHLDPTKIDQIMWWICLDYFKQGEDVIELKCGLGHIFHPKCIKSWAKDNKTCPVCKTNLAEMAKKEIARSYQDPSVSWANISIT